MRNLLVAGLLAISTIGSVALASEEANTQSAQSAVAQPVEACTNAVQLDESTTACVSDAQALTADAMSTLSLHRCEMRCVRWTPWGHCRRWHRYCW